MSVRRAGATLVAVMVAVAALLAGLFADAVHAQQPGGAVAEKGRKEQRIALVIGNGAYAAAPLGNPVNDARAMADALKATGFVVMRRENASLKEMTIALREFGDKLKGGGVGLFYYAGHGMAVKGRNFLIPVDAQIEREDEVAFNALDANAVLDKMESAGNRLNIVILDACRNNPFMRSFRSASQGLAQMDAPVGTLVSFATAPGQVASDGNGKNGLFTQYLLENIKRPGLKIEDLFKAVRVNVRKDSGGKQVPWESSSLEGDFYFIPAPPAPAIAQAPAAGAKGTSVAPATATGPKGTAPTLASAQPGSNSVPPSDTAARAAAPGVAFPAGAPVLVKGDTWVFRHSDLKAGTQREVTNLVDEVLPGEIRFRGGNYITDLAQNVLFDRSGKKDNMVELRFEPGMPLTLFPQRVGESKSGTVFITRSNGRSEQQYKLAVLRREKVSVPAGTFDAFYSEREVTFTSKLDSGKVNTGRTLMRIWYAPEVKRFVKYEMDAADSTGKMVPAVRRELLSYKVAP